MKTLGQLAALVEGAHIDGGSEQIEITGIEHDSRKVRQGTLFVAIPGVHVDGAKFIPQAVQQGARAVLAAEGHELAAPAGVAVLRVPELNAALDAIVPYFHDYPARSLRVIGITGTNGKTTTSYLVRAILRHAGYKVGLIDQNRVAGIEFDTAVFTNLTQDHLDYHKTLENYMRAKARLFDHVSEAGVKQGKTAVVNIDDAAGACMLAHAKCDHLTYAIDAPQATLRAEDIDVRADGACFTLVHPALGRMELSLHITGIFNVYNVMSAVGAALAEHIAPADIRAALEAFTAVPGRFELVKAGQDFTVIVDYAHTPDGVENVLRTARKIAKRRIIAVFGCGGDRDRTKRPIMGRLAGELADVVIREDRRPPYGHLPRRRARGERRHRRDSRQGP